MPYRFAFWMLILCVGVMVGWLILAGCSVPGAVVAVLLLLTLFLIITRIIAETGLVHGQLQAPLYKPWQLAQYLGIGHPVSTKTFYLTALVNSHHFDYREPMPVYTSHALKIADETIAGGGDASADTPRMRRAGRALVGLLMLSLAVSYVTSSASMLWTEYRFDATRDELAKTPINDWGTLNIPDQQVLAPTSQYKGKSFHPVHHPLAHMAGGFVATAGLAMLRLRFPGCPLHPIGFLMRGTFPQDHLWFSIFLGWLLKGLILRFSGAKGYQWAKPLFLGLIIGESLAAAMWMVVALLLSSMGVPYRVVNIMPG